jgi:hypothetical protein
MDHPNTRALFDYWEELRAGRDAPTRSEVDPRRISDALESMFILEALDDGQLRFRLAGTRLCEWLGLEARGCVAETMMARGQEGEMRDLGRRVLLEPAPGVMRLRAEDGAETRWAGEMLLLPMRSELGELARVIGCVNLMEAGRRRQPQPPLRLRCLGVRLLPVETAPGAAETARRAAADPLGAPAGFGEPRAAFGRARGGGDAARPRLTAIEGNPEAAAAREDDGAARPRPNLRLVED